MAAISGRATVTTAGTAVQLAASGTIINGPVAIMASPVNSGRVFVGNTGAGTVSATTGYELPAGVQVIMDYVGNLGTIWVDASADGQAVTWLALAVM